MFMRWWQEGGWAWGVIAGIVVCVAGIMFLVAMLIMHPPHQAVSFCPRGYVMVRGWFEDQLCVPGTKVIVR